MTTEQKQNWIEQRKRPQAEILMAIKTTLPAVWPAVAVVGKWIWVQFQKKPEAAILEGLKGLGFSWSSRRGCSVRELVRRSERRSAGALRNGAGRGTQITG